MKIEVKKTGNGSRMTITIRDDGDGEIRAQIHIDAKAPMDLVSVSIRKDAEDFVEYTLNN